MSLVNTITRPINDFMVARLYGARSFTSWAEDAVARARSEEGGVGMQAAIISGGLVVLAVAVVLMLRNRGGEAIGDLSAVQLTTLALVTS